MARRVSYAWAATRLLRHRCKPNLWCESHVDRYSGRSRCRRRYAQSSISRLFSRSVLTNSIASHAFLSLTYRCDCFFPNVRCTEAWSIEAPRSTEIPRKTSARCTQSAIAHHRCVVERVIGRMKQSSAFIAGPIFEKQHHKLSHSQVHQRPFSSISLSAAALCAISSKSLVRTGRARAGATIGGGGGGCSSSSFLTGAATAGRADCVVFRRRFTGGSCAAAAAASAPPAGTASTTGATIGIALPRAASAAGAPSAFFFFFFFLP
jgi:hypothetical protein